MQIGVFTVGDVTPDPTNGRTPNRGGADPGFHRAEELVDECRAAGLTDVVVHRVEGPAWPAADAAVGTPRADAVFAGALDLARVYSTEPALIMTSAHLLAVGSARRG